MSTIYSESRKKITKIAKKVAENTKNRYVYCENRHTEEAIRRELSADGKFDFEIRSVKVVKNELPVDLIILTDETVAKMDKFAVELNLKYKVYVLDKKHDVFRLSQNGRQKKMTQKVEETLQLLSKIVDRIPKTRKR